MSPARTESQFDTVRQWADEGIPIDAMGTPSEMQAYRQRKGTPVPWDAEKRNKQSKRRSELVQRVEAGKPAGDTDVPDSVRDVISSPGQSLDSAVQREMEDRMGDSFSDVQVHTGPKAAQACDDINAKAFTVGNNIAFNSGEYDPSSQEGQHVLAHELAHVRQQTGGAVSMLPKDDVELEIDPDPELERKAEETAQRVMQGGRLDIQRMEHTDVHVQRSPLSVEQESRFNPRAVTSSSNSGSSGAGDAVREKIDGATTKKYRFTKSELTNLVQSVETEAGLAEYLEHKDIDPMSSIEDSASSPLGGAMKGGKYGMKAGVLGGLPGMVAGGLAGATVGGVLAATYGKEIAGKIQHFIRDTLGLDTDQEVDARGDTGSGNSIR